MFSFLLIAALAAVASASPLPNERIVGGENANIETYPYQVSVQLDGEHTCGGSIVSPNYIITAAHCVTGEASSFTVRAGSTYHEHGGSIHEVEKVILHEKYEVNKYGMPSNDIAVVKVKTSFEFDDTRQPIELYNLLEELSPGEFATITGWGSTILEGSDPSDQLQTINIPIITKNLCNAAYEKFGGITDGQICAHYFGNVGKDTCHGDEGGPLTMGGRLAGIVSLGVGCHYLLPSVYTEIAYYREWVSKHVEF